MGETDETRETGLLKSVRRISMGGTFTSWGALEQALQKEVADATREVIDNSMEDLHRNVDRFYGAAGGRYMRTGTLRSSPECSFMGGGAVSSGEIRLNTGYTYVPSGRDTKTIYNYAESGGLLGRGGFWSDTMNGIPRHIQAAFGSRFY